MLKVIDSFKLWSNNPVANVEPGGYYPTVMDRPELLNDIAVRLDDRGSGIYGQMKPTHTHEHKRIHTHKHTIYI